MIVCELILKIKRRHTRIVRIFWLLHNIYYIYYWRASVVSETLTAVTQLKIGDVCTFIYMCGCMYVILYFDLLVFLC